MSVTEIQETRSHGLRNVCPSMTRPTSPRTDEQPETTDAGATQGKGFTAEAKSLTTNSGVRSVLLDALGESETTKPAGLETSSKSSDRERYRQLIAADIKSAYGREATDKDYQYWLGKLEGPNDSGFVTSGSMSATEYWHRRMLGWQAGGADVATSGPYAGGGGPHGDVQPATDVVPGVAPGGVYNQASPERISELKHVIASDISAAYGREATDEDYGYWLNKFLGLNDSGFVTSGNMTSDEYWHRRLLGWQAGGADVAHFGPYAGGVDTGRPVTPVDRLIEVWRGNSSRAM